MTAARTVTILGSTGSVGRSTVDLIRTANAAEGAERRFDVIALTAQSNAALLAQQAIELGAKLAVIGDPAQYEELKSRLPGGAIACAAGPEALEAAAAEPAEMVMAAIVGTAGLKPALAAVRRGAKIGLANKECLVTAGAYFMEAARRHQAEIVPVDSEHSGVFQILEPDRSAIHQVTLTASGGPFWDFSRAQMARVTPEEACAHPNWRMGAKISVDSATMMNKGLELIEAAHLFHLTSGQLSVLVHRQSIVHALISYRDGSMLAQMSHPDMRTPIAYALGYPGRMAWPARPLNLAEIGRLSFEAPDPGRFPCLRLAVEALAAGDGYPTVLNAANEVAVSAFLAGNLPFLAIAALTEKVLTSFARMPQFKAESLDAILALDAETRRLAETMVPELARGPAVA
jgi:1-deoxy-D-xylulose-5-phosphate reductoisomerase